jgi:hypothetical protein
LKLQFFAARKSRGYAIRNDPIYEYWVISDRSTAETLARKKLQFQAALSIDLTACFNSRKARNCCYSVTKLAIVLEKNWHRNHISLKLRKNFFSPQSYTLA